MKQFHKSRHILISTFLISVFCTAAWAATAGFQVEWKGALRDTHAGDISGKVRLAELPLGPGLYAVGPAANLGGEITVIDGRISFAHVEAGKLKTSSVYPEQASFMVWATVPQWQKAVPLGKAAATHADLEKLIEAKAREAGLDVDKPFPFLLKGTITSVKFHVVQPAAPQSGHAGVVSHTDSALKVQASSNNGTIVGFFSNNHAGVFVHIDSNAHLHVVLQNGDSGHIDELAVGPDVRLILPRI